MNEALGPFLAATDLIESTAPAIVDLARALARPSPRDTAIALFTWTRDGIRYDPRCAMDPRDGYRATAIVRRGSGFCIQKALVLVALCRAVDIPARLGFADIRNHRTPEWLRELMGTDLFVFHGFAELHLDGAWLKATPTFDPESCRRAGAPLVEFDGVHHATLPPLTLDGQPYVEYVQSRGSFADVPLGDIQATFVATYGSAR